MSFEKAIERLEEIAAILEQGQGRDSGVSLEQSLKLYEEGAALAAYCSGALKDAEQRITELSLNTVTDTDTAEEEQ